MKTFDGQEKSLLRAATRNVLPESVAKRTKSPYPQTQDPAYVVALAEQARQLLADDHPVFALADRGKVSASLQGESDAGARQNLEQLLSLATWVDIYRPEIRAA
jgi:asparagine synthase (glutamine-hydrolysing)